MRIFRCLFICAFMLGAPPAQSQTAPQISHTHPPPEEIRKSDLTISGDASQPIACLAYNPNGWFLAVAEQDHSIRVYDARLTVALAQALRGHTAPILALGFNGTNTLVSVSEDGTAKVWDIVSGKLLSSSELDFEKRLIPAIAPKNQMLLAGGTLKSVKLWNYETGELLKTFEVNDSDVAALAFTPDGKRLVIGTVKGVVRLMNIAAWKVERTIDLDSPVHSLAASAEHIAVGYGDGTVALLKIGDEPSVPELKKQNGAINAVAFSPKGEQFASASADGTIKVWDTEALKVLCSQEGHRGAVLSVVFSPNGQKMASGGADGCVNYWTVPLPSIPSADMKNSKSR